MGTRPCHQPLEERRAEAARNFTSTLRVQGEATFLGQLEPVRDVGWQERICAPTTFMSLAERAFGFQRFHREIERAGQHDAHAS
jgi:hypothetical protein